MAKDPRHTDGETGFERQDLAPGGVYGFLGGLAAGVAVVAMLLWFGYGAMDSYERNHQAPQSPLVPQTSADTREVLPQTVANFPQPRLEKNERLEINEFRMREEQALTSYGWVDQDAGVVRIPIERAMQLITERGLPMVPKAVPPTEVNASKPSAQPSDASSVSRTKGGKAR